LMALLGRLHPVPLSSIRSQGAPVGRCCREPSGTTEEVPDRALGCGADCPTACNDLESV